MILRTSFRRQEVGFQQMQEFIGDIFRGELHAKRVLSLSNATVGLAQKGSLALQMALGLYAFQ